VNLNPWHPRVQIVEPKLCSCWVCREGRDLQKVAFECCLSNLRIVPPPSDFVKSTRRSGSRRFWLFVRNRRIVPPMVVCVKRAARLGARRFWLFGFRAAVPLATGRTIALGCGFVKSALGMEPVYFSNKLTPPIASPYNHLSR